MTALHRIPLIDQAMRSLRAGDAEPYALEPAALAALRASMLALAAAPDFEKIVAELCLLAIWLGEDTGSFTAGRQLLKVADAARPILRARRAVSA